MKNKMDSIRESMSQLSDESLVRLLTEQADEFEPEALKIAKEELSSRSIDIEEFLNRKSSQKKIGFSHGSSKYTHVEGSEMVECSNYTGEGSDYAGECSGSNTECSDPVVAELVTFSEVVRKAFYALVERTLRLTHPEDEEFLGEYRKLFGNLLQMTPIMHKNIIIKVVKEKLYTDGPTVYFWHAIGLDTKTGLAFGMDKCSWKDWLGCHVLLQDLETTGHEAFVAHCLYKMTENGFSEETGEEDSETAEESQETKAEATEAEDGIPENNVMEVHVDSF